MKEKKILSYEVLENEGFSSIIYLFFFLSIILLYKFFLEFGNEIVLKFNNFYKFCCKLLLKIKSVKIIDEDASFKY